MSCKNSKLCSERSGGIVPKIRGNVQTLPLMGRCENPSQGLTKSLLADNLRIAGTSIDAILSVTSIASCARLQFRLVALRRIFTAVP